MSGDQWSTPGFFQPVEPDSTQVLTAYSRYTVRPTRRQLLRALITGKPFDLPASRVSGHVPIVAGRVRVECWGGGGGGGEYHEEPAPVSAIQVTPGQAPG